jgi:hypothetical protein
MSKHLTPAVHESWNWRLPEQFRRPPKHRTFEFPARANESLPAGGPTGNGGPSPSSPPVPVGHLTLIERIKEAAK